MLMINNKKTQQPAFCSKTADWLLYWHVTACDFSSAAAQSALWWVFSFHLYFPCSAEETPSEDILMVALEIVSSALEAKNQN